MRILKVKLSDNKPYQFATLTITETATVRKLRSLMSKDQSRFDELTVKAEGSELSEVETNEYDMLQDKQIDNMLKILLISISKNHPQFKVTDVHTEAQAISELKELIDVRDARRITTFVMVGSLPPEQDLEISESGVLDLSEN